MERALKERCCTKKASFVLCDPGVYLEADSFQHSSADVLSVKNDKLKGMFEWSENIGRRNVKKFFNCNLVVCAVIPHNVPLASDLDGRAHDFLVGSNIRQKF